MTDCSSSSITVCGSGNIINTDESGNIYTIKNVLDYSEDSVTVYGSDGKIKTDSSGYVFIKNSTNLNYSTDSVKIYGSNNYIYTDSSGAVYTVKNNLSYSGDSVSVYGTSGQIKTDSSGNVYTKSSSNLSYSTDSIKVYGSDNYILTDASGKVKVLINDSSGNSIINIPSFGAYTLLNNDIIYNSQYVVQYADLSSIYRNQTIAISFYSSTSISILQLMGSTNGSQWCVIKSYSTSSTNNYSIDSYVFTNGCPFRYIGFRNMSGADVSNCYSFIHYN